MKKNLIISTFTIIFVFISILNMKLGYNYSLTTFKTAIAQSLNEVNLGNTGIVGSEDFFWGAFNGKTITTTNKYENIGVTISTSSNVSYNPSTNVFGIGVTNTLGYNQGTMTKVEYRCTYSPLSECDKSQEKDIFLISGI